jgi:NTP pyrophosphatase (non-canonical NTP hydrolase)
MTFEMEKEVADTLGEDIALHPTISMLQDECHGCAVEKGWWDEPRELGTQIALMHSELSEALEAAREGKLEGKDGVAEEFADTIIRIMDTCGHYDINLEEELLKKMMYNRGRDYRHGDKEF